MNPASIFIVDDHPLVRRGLQQLINGEPDLEVFGEAAGTRETLAALSHTMPDLAIIDLSLHDGNGLELAKHLLARFPELLILISSMHDENLFAERALKAGAKGYINKSATGDELINAIKLVLSGKIYVSQQLLLNKISDDIHPEQSPVRQLSNRELEIFEYIGSGMGTADIASKVNLSIKTIESHRANIKKKLGLASSGELVRSAMLWSLESNFPDPN